MFHAVATVMYMSVSAATNRRYEDVAKIGRSAATHASASGNAARRLSNLSASDTDRITQQPVRPQDEHQEQCQVEGHRRPGRVDGDGEHRLDDAHGERRESGSDQAP